MDKKLYKVLWDKEQLWKGCILASIAHAIMVAHYPEVSNEHSWDGINYSVQDSSSARGTITFYNDHCVGAFRDNNSERLSNESRICKYTEYFNGVSENIIRLAEQEALQYLLENVDGRVTPLITTSFWNDENDFYSNDIFEDFIQNGGSLLERQAMNISQAIEEWKEYYDMTQEQIDLLINVYKRKITYPNQILILSKDEVNMIGTDDEEGLDESKTSFSEIGIEWEK
jgi:hypothetical protein